MKKTSQGMKQRTGGRGSADKLWGNGGDDTLIGGAGVRVLRFKGKAANDTEGRMVA